MQFGRLGVFTFTDTLSPAQLSTLAQTVETQGYSTLWYPEAFTYEAFAIGGYLLNHSKKLIVASGIANIYARDPMTSAMGHNSLNTMYGGRFVLGLGVSHAPMVSDMRGHEYKSPVATMKAHLDGMDAAWKAMKSTVSKQVVLAALGPQMSKLSADRTLGAFPYNITPEHVTAAREVMGSKGAIICEQKVCVTTDPVVARKVARAGLAPYLTLPNYCNHWLRLGFDKSDIANGGSDRLMDAMVFWGTADQIKSKLKAYFDNGANQVVIQPFRADGEMSPDFGALEALASLNN